MFSVRYIRARNSLLKRFAKKIDVANDYFLAMVFFLIVRGLKILRSSALSAFWHHGLNI